MSFEKINPSAPVEEKELQPVEPKKYKIEKTHTALAVIKVEGGKFALMEVLFHPDNSYVTKVLTDVREDVIDQFKMRAGELFMGDNIK